MKLKWLFLSFLVYFVYSDTIYNTQFIRYAAILYRHGDRTPVNMYPMDPYKNESLWPVRFGQLTNVGKKQHYALGQWLRTRYDKLVSYKFDPMEVYVRSTNVDRTLMSAQANLAGMYPPVADTIWNPKLNWQPIPVHTVPEYEDEILAMKKQCPRYDAEKKRVMQSAEFKSKLQKYESLMEYLSNFVGYEVTDYEHIAEIFSVLTIESLNNFKLPNWTAKVFPDKMAEPAGYSFTVDTTTELMARLKVGPFLKEVVNNMVKVMHDHHAKFPFHNPIYDDLNGVTPLKLHMYSAHDLNIGSVLNALGLYDGVCPAFTSTILFELVYDPNLGVHFVRILYRNTTEIVEPHLLLIPNCGYRCPLEVFVELYKDIIPDDWNAECNNKVPVKLILICIFGLIFIVFAFACYYYPYWHGFGQRQRNRITQYAAFCSSPPPPYPKIEHVDS